MSVDNRGGDQPTVVIVRRPRTHTSPTSLISFEELKPPLVQEVVRMQRGQNFGTFAFKRVAVLPAYGDILGMSNIDKDG